MCEEDISIEFYLEYNYMKWLKSELCGIGIDARTIARVEEGHGGKCGGVEESY